MLDQSRYAESVQLAKELIDKPGFGSAQDVLEVRGFWDESQEPGVIEYTVYAHAEVSTVIEGWATVYAQDQEDANQKAKVLDFDDFEWDAGVGGLRDHEVDDWNIDTVEAEKC